MKKNYLLIMLLMYGTILEAESVKYTSYNNTLVIPEASVDDQAWYNINLKLETDETYSIEHYFTLPADEGALLSKIRTSDCGSLNTWSRYATYRIFISGKGSSCLIGDPRYTVEGQATYRHLFIENGVIQIISDTRLDSFGSQGLYQQSGELTMKFGYKSNNIFVEYTDYNKIDSEPARQYVLQITDKSSPYYDFH